MSEDVEDCYRQFVADLRKEWHRIPGLCCRGHRGPDDDETEQLYLETIGGE